jgi:hypothetical protein
MIISCEKGSKMLEIAWHGKFFSLFGAALYMLGFQGFKRGTEDACHSFIDDVAPGDSFPYFIFYKRA